MPANRGGGDVRRQVVVEMVGTGADSITILAQATRELQEKFNKLVAAFDKGGDEAATRLIAGLRQIASAMNGVKEIANAEAEAMARSAAATEKFVEQANAALSRGDAEQARIDAQAKARLDARDKARQKDLDAIATAADRVAAAAEKAAAATAKADADMAKANAQAAEKSAKAALEMQRAFEATVVSVDALVASSQKLKSDAIDKLATDTEKARRAFESTVISTDQLAASAQKFKSDNIAKAADDADRMKKQFLDSVIPVESLVMSGLKLRDGFDKTQSAARGASRAVLEFGRAFEDFMVAGPIGALNNMPGLIGGIGQALKLTTPQVAGLEAATAVLGTTLYALTKTVDPSAYIKEWARSLDLIRDPLRDAASDAEGLKEKIKALEEQPFKIQVDYDALREIRAELKKTEDAVTHWEALRNKRTDEQEKARRMLEEGIVEGGGQQAVDKAIREAKQKEGTLHAGSEIPGQIAAEQDKLDWYNRQISNLPFDNPLSGLLARRRDSIQAEVDRLKNSLEEEGRQNVAKTIDQATRTPAGNQALRDLAMRNRDVFARNNVNNDFYSALAGSSPENIAAVEENKRAAKQQEEDARNAKRESTQAEAVARKAATALQHKANEQIQLVGPGYDDKLKKDIHDAIKGGATPDAAEAAQRAGLRGLISPRVPADVLDVVTDALLKKARASALNLIAEGKKPGLDVKAGAKEQHDRDERIRQAGHVGKGMLDTAEAMMDRNQLGLRAGDPGAVPQALLSQRLEAIIGRSLGQAGKDPKLAHDIVAKAFEDATDKYAAALAMTGDSTQALLRITTAAMAKLESQEAALFRQSMAIRGAAARQRRPARSTIPGR